MDSKRVFQILFGRHMETTEISQPCSKASLLPRKEGLHHQWAEKRVGGVKKRRGMIGPRASSEKTVIILGSREKWK